MRNQIHKYNIPARYFLILRCGILYLFVMLLFELFSKLNPGPHDRTKKKTPNFHTLKIISSNIKIQNLCWNISILIKIETKTKKNRRERDGERTAILNLIYSYRPLDFIWGSSLSLSRFCNGEKSTKAQEINMTLESQTLDHLVYKIH